MPENELYRMARTMKSLGAGDPFESNYSRENPVENALSAYFQTSKNLSIMDKMREERQEKAALKNALSGADFSTAGGMEEAMGKVGKVDPLLALKLRQEITKGSAEERKAKTEALKNMVEFNKMVLPGLAGNIEGYAKHFVLMNQTAPELAQTLRHPGTFFKNGQLDMQDYNNYWMNLAHGNEAAKAALEQPKPPAHRDFNLPGEKTQHQVWGRKSDGNWGWINEGEPVNRYKESEGMTVYGADGQPILQMGKGGGPLPKTAETEVHKGLLTATETRGNLAAMAQRFEPEFQTYQGQWNNWISSVKDKFGVPLDEKSKSELNRFTTWRAEAGQMMADRLKAISGTAVTEPEMKRQEVYLVKAGTGIADGDSPEQVKAKLKRMIQFSNRAVARLNYIRRYGYSITNIPLEKMDKIMQTRAEEVAKEYVKRGMSPKDIETKRKIQAQIAMEFGLTE